MPTQLPRVNVTVTEEQHALLLELASCSDLSAAGFLRKMLDAATPLLRQTVPAMAEVSEELEEYQGVLNEHFSRLMDDLRASGFIEQLDMMERDQVGPSPGAKRSERSERGRTGRRASPRA
jgi:hypothetical protein